MIDPKIIYEDSNLLVIDKPPGWVVNDAQSAKNLNILQKWLKENFKYPISHSFNMRSGVVHRLDKDTSGVLLVAKSEEVFYALQAQFKERKVQKEYVALVHGEVKESEGEISASVGRLPWNKRKFGVLPGGREAFTKYEVIKRYTKDSLSFTLLKLYPKTGRTHQIRVHLKYLGYPIVSDKTYAGRKNWRHDKVWCERIFLHAAKISFLYPGSNKKVSFEAELPKDLVNALGQVSST